MTARRDYGPIQLAAFLGLAQWQLDRALDAGLIPGPDRPRGRWSAAVAAAALARAGEISAAAGSVPDLGAVRAAACSLAGLGVDVTGDGIDATRAGQRRTAGESAAYLHIRRSDLDHLIRCRVLRPARHGARAVGRDTCSVHLYRTGDLDGLLARPGID